MEVDHVLEQIGEFGAVQQKMFLMMGLPGMWLAFHTMIPNFIGVDPGWTCTIGDKAQSDLNCSPNDSTCKPTTTALSVVEEEEKCSYYEKGECTVQFSNDFTSIVTEWDLICSKSSYPSLAQSGFFIGLLIGAWVFGNLSDTYGRKKMLFLSLVGCWLSGFGYGLAINYTMFLIFRMTMGAFSSGLVIVSFSLIMEIIGQTKRTSVGMALQVMFSVGFAALALLAYFIPDWKTLSVVCNLLGSGFLLMWRMVPESPRWLLIQGRQEEARAVLSWMAKGNGRQMPSYSLKVATTAGKEGVGMLDLFRGNAIRYRSLFLFLAWFTNCMVYYGLSLNAGNLGGGRYLSAALSGLVELPGLVVAYWMSARIGRKWGHGGLLMMGGVSCLAWSVLHLTGSMQSLKLVLALVGKLAVAGSFAIIYLYSAELFPTEVRSLGLGVSSVGSRLGGILSPLILLLSTLSASIPMIIMGSLGLVTGFLSLSLPETLNQPLPESLAQLESNDL